MKKKVSFVFTTMLFMAVSVSPIYAAEGHHGHSHNNNGALLGDVLEVKEKLPGEVAPYVGEAVYEHENVSLRLADIVVNVTSPLDQSWRSTYTDYYNQANNAVERADDGLSSEFGINFLSVAQPHWSSSSTTSSALLNEARNEHGLNYAGSKKADVMIAFSGRTPSDNSGITGIATLGNAYSAVFDNGYSTNAETTQHEAGHMYGLRHDQDESGSNYGGSCVMTATGFGFIDRFDAGHRADWAAAKNKY